MDKMLTAHIVIKNRQAFIVNEVIEIETQIALLEDKLQELKTKREHLVLEHDLWNGVEEHNYIKIVQTTTTEVRTGRLKTNEKIQFDDVLKQIMLEAGRALPFNEIVARLETFGYKWANYHTAHNFITNRDVLLNVSRGMYQYRR